MVDKVLGILADILPIPLVEDHRGAVAFLQEVGEVLAPERRVAAEQGVRNDTHGPHVDRLAVALAVHDLGGSVAERARHGLQGLLLASQRLGNTKVGEDEVRVGVFGDVDEVLGFQISVDNVVVVQVVNSGENLLDRLRGIFLSEPALLANSVKELSTGGELGDNVELVLLKWWSVRCLTWCWIAWFTLDSNQSTNWTIWGCFSFCSMPNSS
jgi:hypothetical protein